MRDKIKTFVSNNPNASRLQIAKGVGISKMQAAYYLTDLSRNGYMREAHVGWTYGGKNCGYTYTLIRKCQSCFHVLEN